MTRRDAACLLVRRETRTNLDRLRSLRSRDKEDNMVAKVGPALVAAVCAILAPSAWAQPDGRPSAAEMERRSANIAQRYLAVWSAAGDGAAGDVPYVYGPTIRFYGRIYTQAQLAAEKRRAVQLWPVRRYEHRPGTLKVTCNEAKLRCVSQSTVDYAVSNPRRQKSARGSTTLDLGISFAGPRPMILYESGRIRGRDPSA